MSNSDIIALIAVLTSAIIAVTTSLVSYFINKSNLQAKRSEIAFEKRLEAFREIVDQTGLISRKIGNINSKDKYDKEKNELGKIESSFYQVYRKNLVFLPPSIDRNVVKFGNLLQSYIYDDYTDEKANSLLNNMAKAQLKIIDDMQKFVGFS